MKKIITVLRNILLFGLGLALLYFAFRGQDFSKLMQYLREANYFWVGVSLMMGAVAYYSRAARWKLLLEPLGYSPRTSSTFIALMVGYIANLALPRLGEVLRCTILNRLDKVPVEACLGTVVAERVFDLIMLVLVIFSIIMLESELLRNFLISIFSDKLGDGAGGTSPVLYIVLGALAVLGALLLWAIIRYQHFLRRYTLYVKAEAFLRGVGKGLISVRKLRNPWLFVFHTLLIWAMYAALTYAAFFALQETAGLNWQAAVTIMVIGGLGMTAPVQGGIGVFHILVTKGLMLYGVSETAGLSMATILHGSQTLFVIVVGGICLLVSIARVRTAKANAHLQ